MFAMTLSVAAGAQTAPPIGIGAGDGAGMPAVAMPPGVSMPPAAEQPPANAAPASGCETDLGKFQQRRNAQLQAINNLTKGGKNKQLDPIAACPKFRGLVAIEAEMKAWALKNKEWCSIPDQFIESMKAGFAKTPVFAQKACAAAEMQRRAAAGGGAGGPVQSQPSVRLPTGPL